MENLLAAFRAGDKHARQRIHDYYLHLVYDKAESVCRSRRIERDDILGILYLDFATALDRLQRNNKPASEIQPYLTAALSHSVSNYMREISPNLLAPRSTKSRRKKQGLPTIELKRFSPKKKPMEWIFDKHSSHSETGNLDLILDLESLSPLENDIVDLRLAGWSYKRIANRLGVSVGRVGKIMDKLSEKLNYHRSTRLKRNL